MVITHAGSNGNLNNLTTSGCYRIDSGWSNMPNGYCDYGQVLVIRGGGDTIAQLVFPYNSNTFYLRTGNPVNNGNGTWQSWRTI